MVEPTARSRQAAVVWPGRPPGGSERRLADPRCDRGQAPLELIAGLPILLFAAAIGFQLLITGYSLTLIDGAVEAGAAAIVSGRAATPAVERALPGWARGRTEVSISGGRVRVTLRPPSPISSVSRWLSVSSSAWVRRPEPLAP